MLDGVICRFKWELMLGVFDEVNIIKKCLMFY